MLEKQQDRITEKKKNKCQNNNITYQQRQTT
jgi:hypothetical protein